VSALIDLGGVGIASSVSRSAAAALSLAPGAAVAAVFRASAVVVQPLPEPAPRH
jgi:molybdopterin-binding protein